MEQSDNWNNQVNPITNMCYHFKNSKESSSYTLLHAFYVACTIPGSSKKKTLMTSCYVCKKSGVRARLHACLSCVFVGCLEDHFEGHESNHEKHEFAMDLIFGAIYCFRCKDYRYDPPGRIKEANPWLPSKEERELFKNHVPVKLKQSLVGLRGLYNMGLTCYINCIIQVLANTPMMRNYFMSGMHSCHMENCDACLLSEIYQELYSGKDDPLTLPEIIHNLWTKSITFRGKRGSDAQEFYEFYLNDLHTSLTKVPQDGKEKQESSIHNHTENSVDLDVEHLKITEDNTEKSSEMQSDSKLCRCVIHQIFSGKYQEVKICTEECGISSTDLNYWSIILTYDNKDDEVKLTDGIKKCIQGRDSTFFDKETMTTKNLLCTNCKTGYQREQFLIKELPNVLCFHSLCVASKKKGKFSQVKKSRVISPKTLDMSPYIPETANMLSGIGEDSFKIHQSSKNMYILYAVVCHIGGEEDGHYFTYVRKGEDIWYLCDDQDIKPVDYEEVAQCSGTLFFYIKEVLEYEQPSRHLNEHERNNTIQRIGKVNGFVNCNN